MTTLVDQLAREGNGAVQVEASPDSLPPVVTLIGPIKHWWMPGMWDTPAHQVYTQWRDAVRIALVKAGVAVYSPHRAIQGRWNETLQLINDTAIKVSDFIIDLTPPNTPAEGTDAERKLARDNNRIIIAAPPGSDEDIQKLVAFISLRCSPTTCF